MKKLLLNSLAILAFWINANSQCNVNGGNITTAALTVTCDNAPPIPVSLSQNIGTNSVFVVIKQNAEKIELLTTSSNIDFSEIEAGGVYRIQHLSYENGINGLTVGANISNISGCFDFSNSIFITKFASNPGVIELQSGGTQTTICSNKTVSVVRNSGAAERLFWFYTDNQGNIIDFLGASQHFSNETSFDFSNIPSGEYHIYSGGSSRPEFFPGFDLVIGDNVNDEEFCLQFSNPIIVTIESDCGGNPDDETDEECVEVLDNITCRGKKVAMCKNNVSICVSSKRVNRELNSGAVLGACARCVENVNLRSASVIITETDEVDSQSDILELDEFSLFPNPSIDEITITSKSKFNGKIYVYSISGKQMLNQIIKANSNLKLKFSDYNIVSGFYFIKIDTKRNSVTKRFIVK